MPATSAARIPRMSKKVFCILEKLAAAVLEGFVASLFRSLELVGERKHLIVPEGNFCLLKA